MVLRAIIQDKNSLNELKKYGPLILLGKDISLLLEGDTLSAKYIALFIPGLSEKLYGSDAKDNPARLRLRNLLLSTFRGSFNNSTFEFELKRINLRLNIDQLLVGSLMQRDLLLSLEKPTLYLYLDSDDLHVYIAKHVLSFEQHTHQLVGPENTLLYMSECDLQNNGVRFALSQEEPWKSQYV